MWGKATLAMAVSSSSMKVARVTVTAMIHGLMAGRVAATFGKEMEPVVALMEVPGCFDATRDRSVSSNIWYNAISDQLVAELVYRDLNEQRRADPAGDYSQGRADFQSAGL